MATSLETYLYSDLAKLFLKQYGPSQPVDEQMARYAGRVADDDWLLDFHEAAWLPSFKQQWDLRTAYEKATPSQRELLNVYWEHWFSGDYLTPLPHDRFAYLLALVFDDVFTETHFFEESVRSA